MLVLKFPGGEMPWDFSLVFTGDVITEGLPAPVVVLAVAILFWLLLKNTRIGTGIYAIGSDAGSAEANGVDVRRTRFLTFTFAGMCYGAAGLFITANMGGGDPLIGAKMLLQIFAAVVLGGTLIGGGRGGAVGTIFGALTLTVVVNIFLVLGVRTYYTPIVEGVILLIAVLGFSLGRDSPVVEITRFWRATLRALQESSLPSKLRVVGEPIRLGGPDPPAGGAGTVAVPWLDRHRAVLRFAVPAYLIYIVILGVTIGIFGGDFSPLAYLNAMLILTAFLAILGLGQGTVIITGGLDLSVPWTMTFPAIVVTTLCNGVDAPAVWVIPAALGIGIAIGFLNGMTIVLFGLSPIIVTLAMNGILEGVSLLFSSGAPIGKAPPALAWFVTGRIAGIAPIGWFLIAFVVVGDPLPEQERAGPAHLRCRQQPAREPPLRRAHRLPHRRRLRAERLLLRAGRCLPRGLQRPGVLRHGRSLPAVLHRRGGAGRHADHRRPRPLSRHPGRRDPLHRPRHHAVRHGAARGRAQHHLRPRPARRDCRAARALDRLTPQPAFLTTVMRAVV